jgi:hypothetical protein
MVLLEWSRNRRGDMIPFSPDVDALAGVVAIFGPIVWAIIETLKKAGVRKKLYLSTLPFVLGPGITLWWYFSEAPTYTLQGILQHAFYGLVAGLAATGFYKALERKASDPPVVEERRPDLELPGR